MVWRLCDMTDTKLCVPVVTLVAQHYNNLFQQLKKVFKRTIKWNKYKSEMSSQTNNNDLKRFKISD